MCPMDLMSNSIWDIFYDFLFNNYTVYKRLPHAHTDKYTIQVSQWLCYPFILANDISCDFPCVASLPFTDFQFYFLFALFVNSKSIYC